MKAHTKLYMFHFGYSVADFIPCEKCGAKAIDIHHIVCRGMGGSKLKDTIDNLMALCRVCHDKYGDKRGYMDELIHIHQNKLKELVKRKHG